MALGNDLQNKLNNSIVYSDVSETDSLQGKEKILVIKFNLDPKDFNKLTNNGNSLDNSYLSSLVYKFDSKMDPTLPVKLLERTVKDSVLNTKAVAILIVKYKG